MSLVQSLYIIGISLCLFSTSLVGSKRFFGGRRFAYLARYLALEALCFGCELLIGHPAAPLKALWLATLMGASLLMGPCLWLAISERTHSVTASASAPSLSWQEKAAILLGLVLTIPLLETTHWGAGFDEPGRVRPLFFGPAIHTTMLMCIAIFAIQVPVYLLRCRRVLASSTAPGWMQIPLVIVGTTWLLGIARTLVVAFSDETPFFLSTVALIDVSVTVACVYLIVRHAGEPVPTSANVSWRAEDAANTKYAKSPLDEGVRRRIVRKIERAFVHEHVYTDSSLSLSDLSQRLGESEHYVSQVLNQDLKSSFYDLVNKYRIERAKSLLRSDPDRTVLEIALEVGFNAKSTFNTAFRRITQFTPSEFRKASDASSGSEGPIRPDHPPIFS
jgi:AraC-like DNA-binding protein